MRVKLSYTVEEEDILTETAKILGLSANDVQQCISLFQEVQKELQGAENAVPNTIKTLEMIEEFRKALLAVDTRLSEVTEIIEGNDDYRRGPPKSPLVADDAEEDDAPEMFGAD